LEVSVAVLDDARAFLAEDPDPETRAELAPLIARAEGNDAAAMAELGERFGGMLTFGTAGLRGRVESGTRRMNRVMVIKASWALATHLKAQGKTGPVVVAFDGRLSSRTFAADTAAVLAGAGIQALVFDDPVPTPVCAFAVTHLGARAGVMVTASHNPPADNGYKVYAENGAQITVDDEPIEKLLAKAPRVPEIARLHAPEAAEKGLRKPILDDVMAAYLEGVSRAAIHAAAPAKAGERPLRIAYTAMHGVGHYSLVRALRRAGFEGIAAEPTQTEPDGTFRTVAFPNPEEKGALDRIIALATEVGADIILANDPDADRLAVAVPAADGKGWRPLTGNEVGWLLGKDACLNAATGGKKKLVITTLVSSTLLSRMAQAYGCSYGETPTGFKWIANLAMERAKSHDEAFVFGYEEALGYSVGPLVRDKDGVGAAVRLAELARHLRAQGRTLLDELDDILVTHGVAHGHQWSVTLPGLAGIAKMKELMVRLKDAAPGSVGHPSLTKKEMTEDGGVPTMIKLLSDDGTRLIVRPSGTEPKIKFYLELTGKAPDRGALARVRQELDVQARAIHAEVVKGLGVG
jgi:phosphomannomutase